MYKHRDSCQYTIIRSHRSIAYGPRGSYRLEHVLAFLRRHLEEWTEQRSTDGDWRIMYLDAFKPHLAQEVQDFAWQRGYVLLYHGGGTTGITQVNDTDLHCEVENVYCHLEQVSFVDQQLVDPGHIGRTRQQVSVLRSIYVQ